jgi:hypothetical protein
VRVNGDCKVWSFGLQDTSWTARSSMYFARRMAVTPALWWG